LATAIQTLPPEKKIVLHVEDWMHEWALARGCANAHAWLRQIVAAERAAHRLHERNLHRGGNDVPPEGELVNVEPNTRHGHPRTLTPAQELELADLHEFGDAKVSELAERFHIGISTVKRILRRTRTT
jgi:DNA-directed RNA polymerase specialized sigma24 family protein